MGIFGKRQQAAQQATQAVRAEVQQDKPAPRVALSDEDREILESLAVEIAGELRECGLVDAEAVNAASFPLPAVEVEYPDYVVTWTPSIYHYTDDDR